MVEVACGTIAVCLPTLRPLMLKISSQFESRSTSKAAKSGRSAGATELVTIGGAGGPKSGPKHFQRLENDYRFDTDTQGVEKHHGNSDSGSGDELPLNGTRNT